MKRFFSFLMVVSLVFSLFAMTAMAADPTTVETVPAATGAYTTSGSDATYANKQMTILVFSGALPNVAEASIKYIDQAASNPAGEYTFSYVVDMPTVGNYTVLVGGETLTTPLAAGTIGTTTTPPVGLNISGSVAVNTGCKNPQNVAITVYKYNAVTDTDENLSVASTLTNVTSSLTITKAQVGTTVEATYKIDGLTANTKYRIEIKKDFWVKYAANITVGATSVTLNKKTLYSGDFSNDNSVTVADFGILKQNLGKTTANDPNFSTPVTGAYRADANEDGSVNVSDFGQLKLGLGKNIASYGLLQPN